MMPGVNYVIYGCYSARTSPGVSLYHSLTFEENVVAVITQDRMRDNNLNNLKRLIQKRKVCGLVDYSH